MITTSCIWYMACMSGSELQETSHAQPAGGQTRAPGHDRSCHAPSTCPMRLAGRADPILDGHHMLHARRDGGGGRLRRLELVCSDDINQRCWAGGGQRRSVDRRRSGRRKRATASRARSRLSRPGRRGPEHAEVNSTGGPGAGGRPPATGGVRRRVSASGLAPPCGRDHDEGMRTVDKDAWVVLSFPMS